MVVELWNHHPSKWWIFLWKKNRSQPIFLTVPPSPELYNVMACEPPRRWLRQSKIARPSAKHWRMLLRSTGTLRLSAILYLGASEAAREGPGIWMISKVLLSMFIWFSPISGVAKMIDHLKDPIDEWSNHLNDESSFGWMITFSHQGLSA